MDRVEKINSYYEKNFADLEKLHETLNNAIKANINADNYKILGWESRQAQYARFGAFAKNVELDDCSLLDVGCGLADLYHFLTSGLGKSIKYIGIDISEKMIETAKFQLEVLKENGLTLPEGNDSSIELLGADLFKDQYIELIKKDSLDEKVDWVYTSGMFNLNLGNNIDFLEKAFTRFVQLAKKGFSCSMLNVRSDDKESPYFYYSPDEVKKLAIKCGAKEVKLIDDYLNNDFTIIAYL